MNQHLSGSDVGGHGDVAHIAQAEHIHFALFIGFFRHRVAEKQQQVDFVTGDPGSYLLIAALRTAEISVASATILPVVPVAHRLWRLRIPQ